MCDHELESIASKQVSGSEQMSYWFHDNNMKLKAEKCHNLLFGEESEEASVQVGATSVTKTT